MKPLLRTAVLVLLAYIISQLIYWRLVVPQLSHIHQVPLAWWLGIYAPFGVAAAAAGALVSSARDIPRHACIAASLPAAAPVIRSLITGASVGHDTELGDLIGWDPSLWAILLVGFAVMIALFAGAMTVGYATGLARSLSNRGHG